MLFRSDKALLVKRAVTTTRNNGTYELSLEYGNYASLALPDRAVFTFNTSGYKLPKGLALEYDAGAANAPAAPSGKGQVILVYQKYIVNKGVSETVFK